MNTVILRVKDHFEVFDTTGKFLFSADSKQESVAELANEAVA